MAISTAYMVKNAPVDATIPVNVYGHDMLVKVTYAGCVVATGEHNYYDDSDFFAVVWDEGTGTFHEVIYATTRGWTYGNGATVDAPAELIEKYHAKCAEEAHARNVERAKRDVRPGAKVVVVKGRKVAKGTKGVVTWFGPDKFRRNAYRAGVVFEGTTERVFMDAANLEVVLAA